MKDFYTKCYQMGINDIMFYRSKKPDWMNETEMQFYNLGVEFAKSLIK